MIAVVPKLGGVVKVAGAHLRTGGAVILVAINQSTAME
jgi:hypothetical protein